MSSKILEKILVDKIQIAKQWYNQISIYYFQKYEAIGIKYTGRIPDEELNKALDELFELLVDCFNKNIIFSTKENLFREAMAIFNQIYEKYINLHSRFLNLFIKLLQIKQLDRNILKIFFSTLKNYGNYLYKIVDIKLIVNNIDILIVLKEIGYFTNDIILYKFLKYNEENNFETAGKFIKDNFSL